MPKMNKTEREDIWRLFQEDFNKIDTAIKQQILSQQEDAKGVIEKRHKLDKADRKISNQEKRVSEQSDKVDQLQLKMNTLKKDYQRELNKLTEMQDDRLGKLGEAPTPDSLRKLGLTLPSGYRNHRTWNGLKVGTEFDAQVCMEIQRRIDVDKPTQVMQSIRDSVKREFTFCTSKEEAQELYERFHAFGWQKYGADIAPLLKHIQAVNGDVKLLPEAEEETKKTKPHNYNKGRK